MLMRQTLPYTSQDVVLAIVDVSAYSIRVGPAILSRSHGTLDRRCCGWSGLLAYNPLSLIRQAADDLRSITPYHVPICASA